MAILAGLVLGVGLVVGVTLATHLSAKRHLARLKRENADDLERFRDSLP